MKRIVLASLVLLGGVASQARAADTVYYYYNDAQGSPVAVTDANGTVIERTQYAPYGQVLNRPEHDGPGYTKHEEDAATGLTNMQQRYDDKVIGRMLSMDPMDVDTRPGATSTGMRMPMTIPTGIQTRMGGKPPLIAVQTGVSPQVRMASERWLVSSRMPIWL